MIDIEIKDNIVYVVTDEPSFPYRFQYETEASVYDYYNKTMVTRNVTRNIYSKKRSKGYNEKGDPIYQYEFGLGWGVYIMNVLKGIISVDDAKKIVGSLVNDTYRTVPFPNLKDYQNIDALHLLKYKYGLLSCYTSYGKTEVISTLVKHFYEETDMKVLLVVPSKKCRDELVKRLACDRFNMKVPTEDKRIDLIVTNGVSASNRFSDSRYLPDTKKWLESIDCILADEVEYTISNGGKLVYDLCKNAKIRYGFSGTADKIKGRMITFSKGMNDVIKDNIELINYFGQSLVFRLATTLKLNIVNIRTEAFDDVEITQEDFESCSNSYTMITNKIWTNHRVCSFLCAIIRRYPMLFIPINNLVKVISNWIDHYWRIRFNVLLISGEGYTYYEKSPSKQELIPPKILSLTEACEYIKAGKVDVIPSTSAGYRALDLPNLKNILLMQGKIGGVVLQSVGRVARGSEANVIVLKPTKMVPLYSKGINERLKMVTEYYKYCNINRINLSDNDIFRNHVKFV